MISLLFYNLQNNFMKICIFIRQEKITGREDTISAKIGFKFDFDQLQI